MGYYVASGHTLDTSGQGYQSSPVVTLERSRPRGRTKPLGLHYLQGFREFRRRHLLGTRSLSPSLPAPWYLSAETQLVDGVLGLGVLGEQLVVILL